MSWDQGVLVPPKPCPPDRLPLEGETIFTGNINSRSKPDYVIDPETGCWVWQKTTLRGYPQSTKGRVHRIYWERANGPIPDGQHVHHVCKNKACLNPAHMEILSQFEHYKHHAFEKSGLDWERIAEMREVARDPELRYEDLAEMFGCDRQTVMRVIRGQRHGSEPVQVEPRKCLLCGVEFSHGRRNKRYCCREHQQRRHQEWAA